LTCWATTKRFLGTLIFKNVKGWKDSFYMHFDPPHPCAMLTKHFHLTQVFILPFPNIERGNVGCWHLFSRYYGNDFMFLRIFQHNLSMVVVAASLSFALLFRLFNCLYLWIKHVVFSPSDILFLCTLASFFQPCTLTIGQMQDSWNIKCQTFPPE